MQLARDELLEKSRIYQKGNAGTLTNYQQHMNNAAYELCLETPSLVNNEGRLMDLARAKVDEEGYPYKKKRSRSKAFGAVKEQGKRKHVKLSAEFRKKRIEDLSEDINGINSTMALLEKERYKQHNMKTYAQAANVEEQIASKRKEKRALEEELTKLQEKETRSKRYHMGMESKDKKETQGKTQNVQTKGSIQLSLFKRGLKPVQCENSYSETKDCVKSCKKDGSAENSSSEKEDMNVTAEVEEVTKSNNVPADEETKDSSEAGEHDTDSTSGDHFL